MADIARLHAALLTTTGVCTDTRKLRKGAMFFALKGPNFNANAFAAQALEAGCAFAVVDDPVVAANDRFFLVSDTLRALQDLARHHRRTFNIPVLAITGTNGKTTTKELIHAVMMADRSTLATEGNLNNHIGVPLTLLRLGAGHHMAIIEMGASKPGDIAELCAIAEPTHGLITNIGKAHLEGFGGLDGVVRTKTELYDHLRSCKGIAFVHGDDPLLMAKSAGLKRVTYGLGADRDTCGGPDDDATLYLHVHFADRQRSGRHYLETQLVGAYNVPNVLAAVCAGQHFRVPDPVIAEAIRAYAPGNNRSQFTDTGRNHLVLDAYNANPSSMAAALENFAAMPSERPKLAILGDMLELGAGSAQEHQAIVSLVDRLELDALYVGREFGKATDKAVASVTELGELMAAGPVTGKLILLKGSNGIKLGTIVPHL